MALTGIAYSIDLAMLTQVVNDHCREHGITERTAREDVARRVAALFNAGRVTAEQLREELRRDTA